MDLDTQKELDKLKDHINNVQATNIVGLTQALNGLEAVKEDRRQSDISNFKAHTKSGKGRFVDSLAESMGTNRNVATHLNLSEQYVGRLRRQAKKNGK